MYSRQMTRRVAASATREIGAMNTTLIASTEFVTPAQREAQIQLRRQGFDNRFAQA